MKRRTRVLIVDDSVTIRKLVSDLVGAQEDLEVAGVAPNGRIALAKIPQVCPDVVTLDLEMPELDGIETLVEIRKTYPLLPVIMFSAGTESAAAATLAALAAGANDYVLKPSGAGGLAEAMQRVRDALLPRLRHFGALPTAASLSPAIRRAVPTTLRLTGPAPRMTAPAPFIAGTTPRLSGPAPFVERGSLAVPRGKVEIDIVAVGCSTGGPNALSEILSRLVPSLPVPMLITQHMPPIFTRLLAERLTATTPFPVHEARDGDVLAPGQAWLAPGDRHLGLYRSGAEIRVRLSDEPPENSCRPAVDVMFRSVAAVYGKRALGVILTGMGQDGLRGCQELHDLGADIVVQDQKTSIVWGMPGLVARAGLARVILPLGDIADEVVRVAARTPLRAVPAERRE